MPGDGFTLAEVGVALDAAIADDPMPMTDDAINFTLLGALDAAVAELPAHHVCPAVLDEIKTAVLMGLRIGVHLERERHAGS